MNPAPSPEAAEKIHMSLLPGVALLGFMWLLISFGLAMMVVVRPGWDFVPPETWLHGIFDWKLYNHILFFTPVDMTSWAFKGAFGIGWLVMGLASWSRTPLKWAKGILLGYNVLTSLILLLVFYLLIYYGVASSCEASERNYENRNQQEAMFQLQLVLAMENEELLNKAMERAHFMKVDNVKELSEKEAKYYRDSLWLYIVAREPSEPGERRRMLATDALFYQHWVSPKDLHELGGPLFESPKEAWEWVSSQSKKPEWKPLPLFKKRWSCKGG